MKIIKKPSNMEAEQIFKEVMKSEELQTHFGISKEELVAVFVSVLAIPVDGFKAGTHLP